MTTTDNNVAVENVTTTNEAEPKITAPTFENVREERRAVAREAYSRHLAKLLEREGVTKLRSGVVDQLCVWLAETFGDDDVATLASFTVTHYNDKGEPELRLHGGRLEGMIPPQVREGLVKVNLDPLRVVLKAVKSTVLSSSGGPSGMTKAERAATWLSFCDAEQVGSQAMGGTKVTLGREGKSLAAARKKIREAKAAAAPQTGGTPVVG